jgi:hypothetical protein
MSRRPIEIESLPMDANGEPMMGNVITRTSNEVQHITEDGVVKERGQKIVVENTVKKVIIIDSAIVGKTYDVYEGTKMIIGVNDAPNGQICPNSVILGQIVLFKDKVYELIYDKNLPIDETWMTVDRVTKGGVSGEMVHLYPKHLKNQAELMNVILSHECISTSPFVRLKLEHPVEIQETLDIEALITREKALLERQKKAQDEFKKQEEKIKKDREELEAKKQKHSKK